MARQVDLSTCIQATCIQATCIQVNFFFSTWGVVRLKKQQQQQQNKNKKGWIPENFVK